MATEGHHEWVEILEPETGKCMYADIVTGDCRWDAPEDGRFKRSHGNQWWELADAASGRSYYYNSSSHVTVWEKPVGGDIVALGKLQQMQEQLAKEEADVADREQRASAAAAEKTRKALDATAATAAAGAGAASTAAAVVAIGAHPRGSAAAVAAHDIGPAAAKAPSPAGSVNKAVLPKPAKSTVTLEGFSSNLAKHTKGFIFKKKVSIASMLSWSKEGLQAPMLMTLKGKLRKDAVELFKMVQMYMTDRPNKFKTANLCALDCVSRAWAAPALRDELFLQICKQTTENNGHASLDRGWELMAIALNFFPPSSKFFSYLDGYIARHLPDGADSAAAGAAGMAGAASSLVPYCARKLERVGKAGAKRGVVAPTLEEVEQAQHGIHHPSFFGSTLDDIMAMQAATHPDLPVPWVIVALTKSVLKHGGASTEGIFRVPGDIDAVNQLKVSLDRGVCPDSFVDPHVPASTLKLWFRDLHEPLIGAELYDECTAAADNSPRAIAVLARLPPVNRRVLLFIIRFLQIIGEPRNHAATKMTFDNLAMVWAPNFLRCPSDDAMAIFNSTKREMSFVRHLVADLDTSEVAVLL